MERAWDAERREAVKASCVRLRMGNGGGEHEADAVPSLPLHFPNYKINILVCEVQGYCLQRSSNIPVEVPFYEVA